MRLMFVYWRDRRRRKRADPLTAIAKAAEALGHEVAAVRAGRAGSRATARWTSSRPTP